MKYNNRKITIDGHTFDSQKEGNRYLELKLLQRAKEITDLQLQPKFLLQEGFKNNSKTYKPIFYYADFQYYDLKNKKIIVEDVKSEITKKDKVYVIKKKIFLYKYADIYEFKEIE